MKQRFIAASFAVALVLLNGCNINVSVVPEAPPATAEAVRETTAPASAGFVPIPVPVTEPASDEPETEEPFNETAEEPTGTAAPAAPAETAAVTSVTTTITAEPQTYPLETVPETTKAPPRPAGDMLTRGYTYHRLSPEYQEVYDYILAAVERRDTAVRFQRGVPLKALNDIYSAVLWEEPAAACIDGSSYSYNADPVTYMELKYACSKEESDRMEQELNEKVNRIISKRPVGAPTFEVVKYFHDVIIENCVYDLNAPYCDTAYGALVNGRALCQGYSQAMALLCSRAGIENCIVTGFAGEEHMWNMVKMDTGWYHIDVTWDDPAVNGRYDSLIYDYFGLTDADMSGRTVYDGMVPRPKASETAENYFVYNNLYAKSFDEAAEILYRGFLNAVNAGRDKVYLRLSDDLVYSEVFRRLFSEQEIYTIQQRASNAASRSFNYNSTVYLRNPELHTLVFTVIY